MLFRYHWRGQRLPIASYDVHITWLFAASCHTPIRFADTRGTFDSPNFANLHHSHSVEARSLPNPSSHRSPHAHIYQSNLETSHNFTLPYAGGKLPRCDRLGSR